MSELMILDTLSGGAYLLQYRENKSIGAAFDFVSAKRLVACFNACQGFDTDMLEMMVDMGDTLKQRFETMNAELKTSLDAEIKKRNESAHFSGLLKELNEYKARTELNISAIECERLHKVNADLEKQLQAAVESEIKMRDALHEVTAKLDEYKKQLNDNFIHVVKADESLNSMRQELMRVTNDRDRLQGEYDDLLVKVTTPPSIVDVKSSTSADTRMCRIIQDFAGNLVQLAITSGVVLTVEQVSCNPLAMGNHETVISVRPARVRS